MPPGTAILHLLSYVGAGGCASSVKHANVENEFLFGKENEMSMTICYKCRWFKNAEPESFWADVWYNHLCAKDPLPTRTNPTTGKLEHYVPDDRGPGVSSDSKYRYCRDVNPTGECCGFEPAIELVVAGE